MQVDPIGRVLIPAVDWGFSCRRCGWPECAMASVDGDRLLLSLDGFEGPLDLLLDLARAQKVDLARISIVALVDQYPRHHRRRAPRAAGTRGRLAGDGGLARLAEIAPAAAAPAEAPPRRPTAADMLAARLRELEAMRAAAVWLGARPRLGQDVFARGAPERPDRHRPLRHRRRHAGPAARLSRRHPPHRGAAQLPAAADELHFWTVQDAIARCRATSAACRTGARWRRSCRSGLAGHWSTARRWPAR